MEMIKTPRLTLRWIREEDWESLQAIYLDFKKSPYSCYDKPHPVSEEDVRRLAIRWEEACRKGTDHLFFAVCRLERMIGVITANRYHPDSGAYDIGYTFHSDYHGMGYAREALTAVLDYLSGLGVTEFTAGTALNNLPSAALLHSVGFDRIGTEQVSFYQDEQGEEIFFEGGLYSLCIGDAHEKSRLSKVNDTLKKITGIVVEKGREEFRRGAEALSEPGGLLKKGGEVLLEQTSKLKNEAVKLMDDMDRKRVWSGLEDIRSGHAEGKLTQGCLVLEGGSFRGIYTTGVLDVLMENGICLQTTIGTSAGALNGYNYVAGEIGRAARVTLGYRHDPRYFSPRTAAQNRGVIGFHFLLDEIEDELPFDHETFNRPDRRFLVTVTECESGEVRYCEKGEGTDIRKAIQASASMPFVSDMVEVDGIDCLDGGCSVKIPYRWALEQGFGKILVVRTRPQKYRRGPESERFREVTDLVYKNHPKLAEKLKTQSQQYNQACDELDALQAQGRVFQICPSGSIVTGSLEGDMEKLGALYLLGRRDAEVLLPQIREYLEIK